MRFTSTLGLVVLLSSCASSAQNAGPSQMQLSLDRPVPAAGTCPLGVQVRQGIGGRLLEAKDVQRTKGVPARLTLTLTTLVAGQAKYPQKFSSVFNTNQIREAVVTVHGQDRKGRVLPVGPGISQSESPENPEVTKTLDVRFASAHEKKFPARSCCPVSHHGRWWT